MAGFKLLKWLYRHSPVNFYSITEEGETIIKSINNTSAGYKFARNISHEQLEKLRKVTKNFKRTFTVSQLLSYVLLIYLFVFPNYRFFSANIFNTLTIVPVLLLIILGFAWLNAKLFERYLKKHFGTFEKTHFPSSNFIENQSYKEFKLELVKISTLLVAIFAVYVWIGSPSVTVSRLIKKQKYEEAIKITTLWSKILPVDPKWYSLRAYTNFKMKNFGNAINDYDKAYDLENDIYKSMNFDNKIYIKYFVHDYEGALRDFDTEIDKATDEAARDSFLWDKAQFLYCIGHYKEALKAYNRLLEVSDNDEIFYLQNRLYYERSQVLHKLGRDKEAQADIDTANELNLDVKFQNPIPEPTLIMENIDIY